MVIEKQLIKKLYTHNQDAFCEVYEIYHQVVFYVIYSIVRNKETTKELVQDSFIKMWNNIHMFDYNTNFQAWLLTIAKNTAKDYLRTHKPVDLIEDINIICNQKTTKIIYEFNTDVNGVLSELEYNVIVLTIVYNMKRKEVADYLHKPLGTILRVYKEALSKLKVLYEVEEKDK